MRTSNCQTQDLTGRLIVGNSPVTTDGWSGELKGLALYDRELTANEALAAFCGLDEGRATGTQQE